MPTVSINGRFLTHPITGVQRYAHELLKALDRMLDGEPVLRAGVSFELLSPVKGVIHRPQLRWIPLRKVGVLSGHAWEQIEYPLYSRGEVLFCPGNTFPLAGLLPRRKLVTTIHDLSSIYYPKAYNPLFRVWYQILMRAVMALGDAVITVSEAEKSAILKVFPGVGARIAVIHNGVYSTEFEPLLQIPPDRFPEKALVVYIGALSKRKNIHGFLRAVTMVRLNRPIDAVVVGSRTKLFQNALHEFSDINLDGIEFRGQINDTRELIALLRRASCLVFPSFYESSGLPTTEAMACGCPVIASTDPALVERCGDAAIYCDPEDVRDIAAKIEALIGNPGLMEDLRVRGLERARRFSWDQNAVETMALLRATAANSFHDWKKFVPDGRINSLSAE